MLVIGLGRRLGQLPFWLGVEHPWAYAVLLRADEGRLLRTGEAGRARGWLGRGRGGLGLASDGRGGVAAEGLVGVKVRTWIGAETTCSGEDAIISFELLADGHRVERLTLNLTPTLTR